MRRAGLGAFLAVVAVALVGAAVVGATDERRLAFTLSVAPKGVVVELTPGQEACQTPVVVAEHFTYVRFQVGTFMKAGVPVTVTVREAASTVATGRLGGGYEDVSKPAVRLDDTVRAGRRVSVCVRNSGSRRLALYGGTEGAKTRSSVTKDGKAVAVDLTLDFLRERPRSTLSTLPDVFRRAAVFAAGWVAPWTLWLAGVAALLVVPALLAAALSRAGSEPTQEEPGASSL